MAKYAGFYLLVTYSLQKTQSLIYYSYYADTTVFLAYHDSMVAACCLQVSNTVIVTATEV